MENRFLKAAHWQLFILGFGIPILFQIGFIFLISIRMLNMDETSFAFIFNVMGFANIINILLVIIPLFGWLWSVGTKFYSKLPKGINMKLGIFKRCLIYSFVYIILFSVLLVLSVPMLIMATAVTSSMFLLISGLHLLTIFGVGYAVFFVAKTIKSVEMEEAATFNDFIGEFFMIMFFPIGIWFLQPRINKLFEKFEIID